MIKLKYFTISLGFSFPSERATEMVTIDCKNILMSVSLLGFVWRRGLGGLEEVSQDNILNYIFLLHNNF